MKKILKGILRYSIQLVFLAMLLFLLFLQGMDYLCRFIEKEVQNFFVGKVEIGDLSFEWNRIHLLNVRIDDMCDPYTCSLLYIEDVSIPIPYQWLQDRTLNIPRISVRGLKMKIFLDSSNDWNIIRNLKKKEKQGSGTLNLPVKEVAIIDSRMQIVVPLKSKKVSFSLKDVLAKVHFLDNEMLFQIDGQEENVGSCSARGRVNFLTKDFQSFNEFKSISIKNKFNQDFIKTLLGFFEPFEMEGKMMLNIPTIFKDKKWSPIPLNIGLDNVDLVEDESRIAVRNLYADVKFVKGELFLNGRKGVTQIQELTLPFENMESKTVFEKGRMSFTIDKASVFQGDLWSKGTLVYGESFNKEFRFTDCSLSDVMMHFGGEGEGFKGKVFCDMKIALSKEEEWLSRAEGSFHVREGHFFNYPVLLKLFQFVNFDQSSETDIQKADITFRYDKGETIFPEIRISGKTVDIYGEGKIKDKDKLDFTFVVQLNRDNLLGIPVVGDITREVSNQIIKQLITIKVMGTLSDPVMKKESIERVPQKAVGYFFDVLKAVSSPLTGNGNSNE